MFLFSNYLYSISLGMFFLGAYSGLMAIFWSEELKPAKKTNTLYKLYHIFLLAFLLAWISITLLTIHLFSDYDPTSKALTVLFLLLSIFFIAKLAIKRSKLTKTKSLITLFWFQLLSFIGALAITCFKLYVH